MNLIAQLEPGLTGLEQLKAMLAMGGRAPIGKTLDFTFVDVGDGWAAFEGVPGLHAYNPIGTIHGGYIAALLDSACGCAGHSKLSATQAYTTLELKIAYHKAVTDKTGLVRAEGRVITFGRRVAFTEATLKDQDGKLYASATSTLLVFER
jgi:uncharacterized protein (TIGR00369 family)